MDLYHLDRAYIEVIKTNWAKMVGAPDLPEVLRFRQLVLDGLHDLAVSKRRCEEFERRWGVPEVNGGHPCK